MYFKEWTTKGEKHWNILTWELMQCTSFNKWTLSWRWPSKAETCSGFIVTLILF
jgi:hypothetical protein